jgi:LEA14-like dessication related protein
LSLLLGLIIVVILGAAIWWFKGSRSENRYGSLGPVLKLANFNVKEMTLEDIVGEFAVHLSNTLPVTLRSDSLHYELLIDSIRVMEESYPKSIEIKKNESLTITLPVKLKYAKLKKAVSRSDQRGKDSADYTFISRVETKVPILGQRQFKTQFSKRLPMLQPITVSAGRFKMDQLGLKESSMGLDVIFKNENVFPIRINHGRFLVQVEKDMQMEGDLKDHIDIPARGETTVPVHADVKLGKLPRLGWQMLFQKGSTNYAFDFTGEIESKHDIINNSHIHLTSTGTMKDMKEVMKAK